MSVEPAFAITCEFNQCRAKFRVSRVELAGMVRSPLVVCDSLEAVGTDDPSLQIGQRVISRRIGVNRTDVSDW